MDFFFTCCHTMLFSKVGKSSDEHEPVGLKALKRGDTVPCCTNTKKKPFKKCRRRSETCRIFSLLPNRMEWRNKIHIRQLGLGVLWLGLEGLYCCCKPDSYLEIPTQAMLLAGASTSFQSQWKDWLEMSNSIRHAIDVVCTPAFCGQVLKAAIPVDDGLTKKWMDTICNVPTQ